MNRSENPVTQPTTAPQPPALCQQEDRGQLNEIQLDAFPWGKVDPRHEPWPLFSFLSTSQGLCFPYNWALRAETGKDQGTHNESLFGETSSPVLFSTMS